MISYKISVLLMTQDLYCRKDSPLYFTCITRYKRKARLRLHEQFSGLLLLVNIMGILSEIFSSKFETDIQNRAKMFSLPYSNMSFVLEFRLISGVEFLMEKDSTIKRLTRLRENIIWLVSAL